MTSSDPSSSGRKFGTVAVAILCLAVAGAVAQSMAVPLSIVSLALLTAVGWVACSLRWTLPGPAHLALAAITVQYGVVPLWTVLADAFLPEWLGAEADPHFWYGRAALVTMPALALGGLAFEFASMPLRKLPRRSERSGAGVASPVVAILVLCSVVSVALVGGLLGMSFTPEDFALRRVLLAGTGYVDVLATAGLVGNTLIAIRAGGRQLGWREVLPLVGAGLLAGLPFALRGQRGGFFYPTLLSVIALTLRRSPSRRALRLPAAIVLLVVLLDPATSYLRLLASLGGERAPSLVQYLADEAHRPSRSFAHLELLAATWSAKASGIDFQSTLAASFTNWIPRMVYPEKPITSGPVLAGHFSPLWMTTDGLHTSSYTTGPALEGFLAGGPVGAVALLALIGGLAGSLVRWFWSAPRAELATCFYVCQTYLLGWDLWVNDLGGAVNRQFMFGIVFLGLWLVRPRRAQGVPT